MKRERKTGARAFVYYFDWAETLLDMPADMRLKIDDAIKRYALYGEEPTDPAVKYSPFALIRQQIDRNNGEYAERCERTRQARSEAGRKGNEKRWGKVSQTSQKSQTSLDSDSDSDSDSENIEISPISNEICPLTEQGSGVPYFNRVDMGYNSPCECRTATGEQCKRRATWEIDGVKYCNQHAKDIISSTATDKRFKRPSVDEVRDYIASHSYSVDAEAFCDFYEAKGWRVGNNPMKNWQAAVRTWERRNKSESKANPKKSAAPNGVKLGVGEWIDDNGLRRYGTGKYSIPMEAPPRPGDKYAWDAGTQNWVIL